VFRVGRHDLVARLQPEPGEHDVAAVGGRIRQRNALRSSADQRGEQSAKRRPRLLHLLDVGLAAPPVLEISPKLIRDRFLRRPRERAERARVEVRDVLEYGEQRPSFVERHSTTTSTGVWSDSRAPSRSRRSGFQRVGPDVSSSPRTSTWSIPGAGREKPHSSGQGSPSACPDIAARNRRRLPCARRRIARRAGFDEQRRKP
jgi:hypothetical protein